MTPFNHSHGAASHANTRVAFSPVGQLMPLCKYAPGVVLSAKYRLEALLGEGGMGAVWSASNILLDLPVAIKLIRGDLDRSALRERLQLEARSAAKLGHPGIVRVYDVGESEHGDPYIVMELVRGETLAQMLTQGRLPAARAVQLLLPVIDALACAHAHGIVHRDLKPDNVMIAQDQDRVQPKILDFGIAKLTDPGDTDHKLTEIGMVVGSPEYMSPEQARGRDDVDASSDVWATCVVLYEAVTGTTPFAASNYNALLRAIVEDDPVSLVDHAAGDLALWEIVKRGLAKDRRNRYASISELGRVLAGWLVTHGVFEDACGKSVEAKWLGSEPVSSGLSTRSLRADFQAKTSHDSDPKGTNPDSSGPFTATIRSHSTGPGRRMQVALGACAVLSVLAVGFVRAHAQPTVSPAVAAAHAAQAPELDAPSEPVVSVLPVAPVPVAPTPVVVAPAAVSAHGSQSGRSVVEQPALTAQAPAATTHVALNPAAVVARRVVYESPTPAAPSLPDAAKSAAAKRTLDLLPAY